MICVEHSRAHNCGVARTAILNWRIPREEVRMPLQVTCGCGKTYKFREEAAGHRVKCQACGQIIVIPGVNGAPKPPVPAPAPLADRSEGTHAGLAKPIVFVAMGAAAVLILVGLGMVVYLLFLKLPSDPGFTVSLSGEEQGSAPIQVSWLVTNTRNQPLVIKAASYNGEWEAPLADKNGYHRVEKGLPVTLTIGESCRLFQYSYFEDKVRSTEGARIFGSNKELTDKEKQDSEGMTYRKNIIYIDFDTNRGRFRYFPDEKAFK